VAKKSTPSSQHINIEIDLEWPRAQKELQDLEIKELNQIEATIEKIKKMTWDQVYKTSSKSQKRGLNWEPIEGQQTATGKTIASIRVSRKSRARVCRDGNFFKFISFHPDHDSAYGENGGEDL
jgi:hypothetical protein